MKHDLDSVKFICERELQVQAVTSMQQMYRRAIRSKGPDYKKRKAAVMKIQKKWRRRKYLQKVVGEKCVICMSGLDLFIGDNSLLPCEHVFHRHCIKKWRRRQNTCPICKSILNKPILTI